MRKILILVFCFALSSCGGGGSGGAGGGSVLPVASPPSNSTYSVSGGVSTTGSACDGVASNCAPTGPASGFGIVLGGMPTAGNGGSPIAPIYNATADAGGVFSIASVPAGTYEIQIAKDATFATLHAKIVVTGPLSLSYAISALGSGEQAWFAAINSYRTQHGSAAINADEYSMEAERAYAAYLSANHTTICSPSCINYPQFSQQYQSAGGLFSYGVSYRVALPESYCPSFAEQDSNQGAMLVASAARFGGYGYRLIDSGPGGSCAFAMVSN